MYSSPRSQWVISAHRLLCVPVGMNSAASLPVMSAICACSALTLGSSPKTSSPSGAANMASRMASVGWVTVSLRRSTVLYMVCLFSLKVRCVWPPHGRHSVFLTGFQEIRQHGVAMLGEDALGVKLHAFDVEASVFDAHNFAVVGPSGHLQTGRTAGALDRQRMVAVDGKLRGQTGKHTLLCGGDDAGLAVHQLLGPNDLAAKGRAYGLMPQADAQNRQFADKVPNGSHRNARFSRGAGTGGNDQPVERTSRQTRVDVGQSDFVITCHAHVGTQLTQVLDNVIGKAVVVVDH